MHHLRDSQRGEEGTVLSRGAAQDAQHGCLLSPLTQFAVVLSLWLPALDTFSSIRRAGGARCGMGRVLGTTCVKGTFIYVTRIHSWTTPCRTFGKNVCLVNSLRSVLLVGVEWQLWVKCPACPFPGFSFRGVLTVDIQGEFPQVRCCLWCYSCAS